jgi:hypothetical protein
MIVNIILLLFIVFVYLIVNTTKIIYSTSGGVNTTVEVVGYLVVAMLLLHLCYCLFIFFNVRNRLGADGPPGLQGPPGNPGKDGKCNANCGQKVCNALVLSKINEHFKNKANSSEDIKNKIIIEKVNKICYSKNYYSMLVTKHENRPNEKKLIEYIQNIYIEWIDLILKHRRGKDFLLNENANVNFFTKSTSPFNEISKYDIWGWGDAYTFKPIVRIQCAKESNKPRGENQKIFVYYSNKYNECLFKTTLPSNKFGPTDCPFNQLGTDFTNPRQLTKCYYFDNNNNSVLKDVFLQTEYKLYKSHISFFNLDSFITENNQQFYPVGTIWRGNNREERSKAKPDDIGPEKYTILISGETETPVDFNLIWSSSAEMGENYISIWRPVCPEGYVSLGDYVHNGINKPRLDSIRCIKQEYAKEVKYDDKVWTEDGFSKNIYDNTGKKTSQSKLNRVSIWPIGYNNVDEEKLNLRNNKLIVNGGYSLFRASDSHNKPNEKAYVIDDKYTYKINTPDILGENTELGFGWMGGKPREGQYSIYNYLGITTYGIISNTETNHSPDGLGYSFYVEHIKDNLYGIKAQNDKTNLFDMYYMANSGNLSKTQQLSKSNPNQHWEIIPIRDGSGNVRKMDDLVLVHLRNKETNKHLNQYYNSDGISIIEEVDGSSGSIFQFQSYNSDIFN